MEAISQWFIQHVALQLDKSDLDKLAQLSGIWSVNANEVIEKRNPIEFYLFYFESIKEWRYGFLGIEDNGINSFNNRDKFYHFLYSIDVNEKTEFEKEINISPNSGQQNVILKTTTISEDDVFRQLLPTLLTPGQMHKRIGWLSVTCEGDREPRNEKCKMVISALNDRGFMCMGVHLCNAEQPTYDFVSRLLQDDHCTKLYLNEHGDWPRRMAIYDELKQRVLNGKLSSLFFSLKGAAFTPREMNELCKAKGREIKIKAAYTRGKQREPWLADFNWIITSSDGNKLYNYNFPDSDDQIGIEFRESYDATHFSFYKIGH
ncbi:hypothetical protein QR680_002839 [Steinernema hermaphroditum]|uniref:Uncharacterized protein n=1 Tax=Steinernema hermaphroditum TaxID=289476 RepID=A0AA39LIW8_9BILA|nr:hypothetical protein QR680_002839 [Steinernema hermaphroditum]